MLKGIDPLLTPDLLRVLAAMGHGDEIAVVDANFTAASLAGSKPLIQLTGAGLERTCLAVLSLLPLDDFVDQPVAYMQVSGSADAYRTALQRETIAAMVEAGHCSGQEQCQGIERFAFYDRVSSAYAVVQTGELQPWANFIFKKGVLAEALRG